MQTVTSAANTTISGSLDSDWITSSGDGVTISALAGDDYVIARGQGSYIYGASGNDTLIMLPPLSPTENASSGSRPSSTSRPNTNTKAVSADTEIHGGAGNDDIMVVHDSAIVYGDAGDDYITVRLYESAGEFMSSLHYITLTGGDGRDTFYFNTSLTPELESLTSSTSSSTVKSSSTVPSYRIEAIITDFSQSAHFCYDASSEYLIYSILTDSLGNKTDIVLRDDAERFNVTLQGVSNIEDIVYANAIRFNGDTLETSYLGEVIANYGEDMAAIPAGITYYNYTVYVYDQYQRNVWLSGTDEVNKVSTYRNISAKTLDARNSTRKRTLVGNIRSNVIYAGSGGDSLWGGNSANDTLYGGANSDMFWYGAGDGTDCIKNFVCGSDSNSDVINLYNGSAGYTYRENNTMHILMTTGEELIVALDYDVDTEIQYSTDGKTINRAKVGDYYTADTISYDAKVNIFIGGSTDNTLKVDGSRNNMIWLDGSYAQIFQDISVIDASTSTGKNQLAGTADKDVHIIGGEGASSLWGGIGSSSNDTLTGGAGAETFFYGSYQGNDIIVGATSDDTINLYDITLSNVTNVESSKDGMKITFNDGAYSLTLQKYSGSPTFAFAQDGNQVYEKDKWVAK